jgi:uncharacterized protein (DUF58 family)
MHSETTQRTTVDRPIAAQVVHTGRRSWGVRLTAAGFAFILSIVVTGLVAVQPSGNLLVILLGMFLGAFGLNCVVGWWSLRRLQVMRVLPEASVARSPDVVRYVLRLPRRRGRCYGLHIIDRAVHEATGETVRIEAFAPILRGRHEVTITAPVCWSRRGDVRFENLRVESDFPFGFLTKRLTIPAAALLSVYPPLGRLRASVVSLARQVDVNHAAETARNRSGGDEEFFGLRQYRPGDNPRRIHWRRSARTGELFVREMSRPGVRRVFCVLNTHCGAGDVEALHRLESAVSCMATIVCDALERGFKVGLIANGTPALASPPGGGRALRGNLLRELAQRGAQHDESLSSCLERMAWPSHWRGTCILVGETVNDDMQRAAHWLGRHAGPVTLIASSSTAFDGIFEPHAPSAESWADLAPVEHPIGAHEQSEAAA